MTTLDRDSIDTTQHEVSRLTVLDRAHLGDIDSALDLSHPLHDLRGVRRRHFRRAVDEGTTATEITSARTVLRRFNDSRSGAVVDVAAGPAEAARAIDK